MFTLLGYYNYTLTNSNLLTHHFVSLYFKQSDERIGGTQVASRVRQQATEETCGQERSKEEQNLEEDCHEKLHVYEV